MTNKRYSCILCLKGFEEVLFGTCPYFTADEKKEIYATLVSRSLQSLDFRQIESSHGCIKIPSGKFLYLKMRGPHVVYLRGKLNSVANLKASPLLAALQIVSDIFFPCTLKRPSAILSLRKRRRRLRTFLNLHFHTIENYLIKAILCAVEWYQFLCLPAFLYQV